MTLKFNIYWNEVFWYEEMQEYLRHNNKEEKKDETKE